MSKYIFFWGGPCSQWVEAPITINGMQFNTCEQWMMWNKAKMFGDTAAMNEIMSTRDPAEQKRIGRRVKNFDDAAWMTKAFDIVVEGNRAKFTQHQDLNTYLMETKGKEIVEASPYDTRWGIGMAASDPGIEDPSNWKGDNLLGKAIMQVRKELFGF